MLNAIQKKAGWIETPPREIGDPFIPIWVYGLTRGDEMLKCDGRICIFDRKLRKNVTYTDDKGKQWRGKPGGFIGHRPGDPDNIKVVRVSNPRGYKTDEMGARSLRIGDVALFIMGPRRIYVARVDGTPNPKTIAATDINGKGYRYPLNAFVCKLPAESFPVG